MCGAPGASVGTNARQWGVESRQGAENSALKNIAPFNRTPFNTSENASILHPLPPDAPHRFVAPAQGILSPPDSRARTSTAYGQRTREPAESLASRSIAQSRAAPRKAATPCAQYTGE